MLMSGKAPPRHASQQLLALLAPIDVGLGLARDFSWRIAAPDISPTWRSATLSRTFIISFPAVHIFLDHLPLGGAGGDATGRRLHRRKQPAQPVQPRARTTRQSPLRQRVANTRNITLFRFTGNSKNARVWLLTRSVPPKKMPTQTGYVSRTPRPPGKGPGLAARTPRVSGP